MRDFKLKDEFVDFIRSFGIVSVAVGIVMGNAVAKIINVVVESLMMPIVGLIFPDSEWQRVVWHLGRANFKIGLIIAAFLDFFSVAIVVFFVVRYILRMKGPKDGGEDAGRKDTARL
ncbi:MAG: MscL family protein [Candidatus Omnitrophica bacterium]|jgi:large conductance mechanosensitive channel|nr:MscL family protein [Candidatus Omnitrophota bacterium]